jgi:phage/plasmid-associated DNA primase
LFCFLDEAHIAEYHRDDSVLKALITEPVNLIEQKGRDPFTVKNHLSLVISSNASWVVPASMDERRYFCLDVGNGNKQDNAFFSEMIKQLENGGYQGLLYDLLEMDISEVDLWKPPKTESLIEQIINSMTTSQAFIFNMLVEGCIFKSDDGWCNYEPIPVQKLYDAYIDYCTQKNEKYRLSSVQLSKEIGNLINVTRRRIKQNYSKKTAFEFPSLEEARNAFESRVGEKIFLEDDI